ncbi:hypothetical protein [Natrialba sp. PRR66]|uniref:hypothetical protein n=1 Tax=Natrialba sp. PRR66 TaxID=3098146 RepID=UPI002B1E6228|nr:hypothetical protein [Natrialba sp. PRR66]
MSQNNVGDALVTLVVGPFIGLAIGVLFYAVAQMYVIMRPTEGSFTAAYDTIGTSLSISYSLFQLASSLETWIAIAVIAFASYSFFASLGGSRGRGGLGGR